MKARSFDEMVEDFRRRNGTNAATTVSKPAPKPSSSKKLFFCYDKVDLKMTVNQTALMAAHRGYQIKRRNQGSYEDNRLELVDAIVTFAKRKNSPEYGKAISTILGFYLAQNPDKIHSPNNICVELQNLAMQFNCYGKGLLQFGKDDDPALIWETTLKTIDYYENFAT